MAAHFDDDDDDLWKLAESYVELFPPRRRASPLTDLDEVEFRARFRDSDDKQHTPGHVAVLTN